MSFSARFEFGEVDALVIRDDVLVLVNEFYSHGVSLEEAIPQLERLLETAKMIVNKEAQEATHGE